MTETRPHGLQLTALDPEYRQDPYPRLRALRETCPVYRDPYFGSVQLTRYADVRAVLTDRSLWRDPIRADDTSLERRQILAELAASGQPRQQSILTSDDPDHGRIRGLLTPVLYRRFSMSREMVVSVIDKHLDALAALETFDLIEKIATPIPIEVIAHLLGVDEERLEEFRSWSEAIVQTFNPERTTEQTVAMEAGFGAAIVYLSELLETRRRDPKEDLISDLVGLQGAGAELSDEEIRTNCLTLLIAGNLTTTDVIGNGVHLFLTHPVELAKLKADPDLINGAVEEILRFEPPVDATARVASHDIEVGGRPIHAGEALSPFLRAANRDPEVFEAPDTFDISRKRAAHVAFGGGAHICLGAPLARMEAQAAFLRIFDRFPSLRLLEEGAAWRPIPFFRGLENLWVATR
ncbi:MAG: cytochrome P450 [Caulobacteraceae bacterium]|nr:cytochrome P450 [Caulobacteraceae bacterium]